MSEELGDRVRELARRAGISGISPRVAVAAAGVLMLALVLAAWRWWPASPATGGGQRDGITQSFAASPSTSAPAAEPSSTQSPRVWVHVVGAVRRPGLYAVEGDRRVNDAIEAAGGVLGDAALSGVNLARKVSDGEQVRVPTEDEIARDGGGSAVAGGAGGGGGVAPDAGGGVGAGAPAPVDLNSATAAQLDTLPGVGPATALKIVADREANGPFQSVDDLGRVAGIGPKKLEQLKDLACVR